MSFSKYIKNYILVILLISMNIMYFNKAYSNSTNPDTAMNSLYSKHSYLCIPDKVTGFHYDEFKKKWIQFAMNSPVKKRFITWQNDKWSLSELGKNNAQSCEKTEFPWLYDSSDSKKKITERRFQIYLRCELAIGELVFKENTLRYAITNSGGYIFQDASLPVFIEIGSCTKL